MADNIEWLTTVPASDINFKSALQNATDEEIRKAIYIVGRKTGTKTRIAALERELRKRERSKGNKNGTNSS